MSVTSVTSRRVELLRHRLDRFTKTLDGVGHGQVRALHRARVGARRLREIVPVLQLDSDDARKVTRGLRKIVEQLGVVRELDVLRITIEDLLRTRPSQAAALRRVGVAVEADRDVARAALFERMSVADLRRVATRLDRLAGGRPAPAGTARAWRWVVEARVARRASRLAKAIEGAGAVYLPERLHDVRIALKKLRYATELKEGEAGHLRTLKRAQDLLGRMHDLQVLIGRARQVQASLSPPDVRAWKQLDQLVGWLEDECRRLHATYVRIRAALIKTAEQLGAIPDRQRRGQAKGAPRARRAG